MVIGQDGAAVFLRHAWILVRVFHSRLCKFNTQEQDKSAVQDDATRQKTGEKRGHDKLQLQRMSRSTSVTER